MPGGNQILAWAWVAWAWAVWAWLPQASKSANSLTLHRVAKRVPNVNFTILRWQAGCQAGCQAGLGDVRGRNSVIIFLALEVASKGISVIFLMETRVCLVLQWAMVKWAAAWECLA